MKVPTTKINSGTYQVKGLNVFICKNASEYGASWNIGTGDDWQESRDDFKSDHGYLATTNTKWQALNWVVNNIKGHDWMRTV